MPGTGAYLVIGAIAAVATFLATPVVAIFARRMGWVVEPDDRRIHKVATPDVLVVAVAVPPSVPPPLAMVAVTTTPLWLTVTLEASRS